MIFFEKKKKKEIKHLIIEQSFEVEYTKFSLSLIATQVIGSLCPLNSTIFSSLIGSS